MHVVLSDGFTYGSLTAAYLTQWMSDCATGVKSVSSSLYVSFAEVAPYFGKVNAATATSPCASWLLYCESFECVCVAAVAGTSGGISQVYALGGAHIDWITVLYYNHVLLSLHISIDVNPCFRGLAATQATPVSSSSLPLTATEPSPVNL